MGVVTVAFYSIDGGVRLHGDVPISGAKNAALPAVVAAALASDGESVIENVPQHTDVLDLLAILEELGVQAAFTGPKTLSIAASELRNHRAPYAPASRLRASTYIAGLLLARLGRAEVALPGGDDIGARPVDFHLRGLRALGADVGVVHGAIEGEARQGLQGAQFFVDRQSVGTTCNLMIAASLAQGTTVLQNAAREPEVVDLANLLNAMGGRVLGAGTGSIRIEGVAALHGARHEIIPDRIEAGTFLLAAAATGGRVTVHAVIPEHLQALLEKLRMCGIRVRRTADAVTVDAPARLRALDARTEPYPGFPTDLQPQIVAVLARADGVSVIEETVFENRLGYTNDLVRLGAEIRIIGQNTAIVTGVETLSGAPVEAVDIRAGAALIIAGLAADGRTEVAGVRHIARGYEDLEGKLRHLGAHISLVDA